MESPVSILGHMAVREILLCLTRTCKSGINGEPGGEWFVFMVFLSLLISESWCFPGESCGSLLSSSIWPEG